MIRVSTGGFYLSIVHVNTNEKASVCFWFYMLVKKDKLKEKEEVVVAVMVCVHHICLLIPFLFSLRTSIVAKVHRLLKADA